MRILILGICVVSTTGCGIINRVIPDRPKSPVRVVLSHNEYAMPSDYATAFAPAE
jgi:hypothetical protein